MHKKSGRRFLAAVLALCLVWMSCGSAVARTIDEIEEEQAQLDQEDQELAERIEQLKDDISQKQEYAEALTQRIQVKQEYVDQLRQDIDDLNAQIDVLTLTLKKSQEEIQSTMDRFKERLVTLYEAGSVGTLEILLNSSSFTEFTKRSELVDAMARQDQAMMEKISDYMDRTQDERQECEASKKKVGELKKELENQLEELNALYAENEELLAELQAEEANAEARQEEIASQREANDAEMEQLIEAERQRREEEERRRQEALEAAGTANGGTIPWSGNGGVEGFNPIWPLPGVTYISAGYGGYPGHKGLDIAGNWGTPVVAAESGTVIAANDYDSWGMSWGDDVLIYHNDTFTTRYAHLSSLAVSEGQYVEQGTIIGYEGDTGNVTGPHLHYEVYMYGTRVDPMQFF